MMIRSGDEISDVREPKKPDGLTRTPKYRQIVETMREEISNLAAGVKLPRDVDLSRRFGTSRLTVMHALRILESENLVERRAGAGTFVGKVARSASATPQLGLLIPDLGEGEIFEPICQGMARAWQASHQALVWGKTSADPKDKIEQAEDLCRYFISQKVSGVFFSPVELVPDKDAANIRIAHQLERAGIPIVLLDRCIYEFPNRSRHDLVGIDNRREGYRMSEYLLELGCRRLGFVVRPDSASTVLGRLAGWREALNARGIAVDPGFVLWAGPSESAVVEKWFKHYRPDGIVCANDLTAAHTMHALIALGVQIPDDVRLVGFDDVKYASLLPVPLTTLRQPCLEIGAAAIGAMLDRLSKPDMATRDILLSCDIVVRKSCGGFSGTAEKGD